MSDLADVAPALIERHSARIEHVVRRWGWPVIGWTIRHYPTHADSLMIVAGPVPVSGGQGGLSRQIPNSEIAAAIGGDPDAAGVHVHVEWCYSTRHFGVDGRFDEPMRVWPGLADSLDDDATGCWLVTCADATRVWLDLDERRWFCMPPPPAVGLGDDPEGHLWMPLGIRPFLAEWVAFGLDEQTPFPTTETRDGVEDLIYGIRVGQAFAYGADTTRYAKTVVSIQPASRDDLPRDEAPCT